MRNCEVAISEEDLDKLDQIAKQAWTSGKGDDQRKMVHYGVPILSQQKARWLIVQEASGLSLSNY
jgi:hypothetical protein